MIEKSSMYTHEHSQTKKNLLSHNESLEEIESKSFQFCLSNEWKSEVMNV